MSSLSTTTDSEFIEPIHPGEILAEDFMDGFALSSQMLANAVGVPEEIIDDIIAGESGITADLAIRFARYFGTSEEFWMNLESSYELRMQRRALRSAVLAITPLKTA